MINGILNIFKEKGYTSHDVVARLRGIIGQKKIGHTGTLDPEAEGVLPVCLGRATKVCDMLTDRDKTYETVLLLGQSTDTQDIWGKITGCHSVDHLREEEIQSCIHGFIGEYDQIPPMYSALKVGGKKLYELAREGKTVERKSRKVMIYDIRISKIDIPFVSMEVKCSKGTYIRTLCSDIGDRLGTGGCMQKLLRTRAGQFLIQDSLKLEDVDKAVKDGMLHQILIPVDRIFADLDEITVNEKSSSLAYNGNILTAEDLKSGFPELTSGTAYRIYDTAGCFIGIFRSTPDNRCLLKPEKMFLDPENIR